MPQINLEQILAGLRQPLPGAKKPSMTNEPAELDFLQGGLQDEFQQRSRMEQGLGEMGYPNMQGRFAGQAEDIAKQRAGSTIGLQKPMIDAFNQNNYGAAVEGFGAFGPQDTSQGNTPLQSREIFRRENEQEKMRQPVNIAGMNNASAERRQAEQSRGIIEQARIGADSRLGQMENMMTLLGGGLGGRRPSRVSMPGGGSIGFETTDEAPNSAYKGVEDARREYDAAAAQAPTNRFSAMFRNDQTPMRKAALDQAIQGYLGQLDPNQFPPQIKSQAWELFNNADLSKPELKDTSSDEILEFINQDNPGLLPQDVNQYHALLEILRTMRGK